MTEDKNNICCSWYESCTYYMQCEHLYNENKDLSEDVYRLEQENKELKALNKKICEDCSKEIKVYWNALEEIREILIICKEFRTCERCKFYKECNKDLEGCITDKINEVLTP